MTDGRTYLRILYLLLTLPLGTLYFTVIVTGLSVGGGLVIVIVGFPILLLTVLCWLLFARVEREMAIHMLGADVRPTSVPDQTPRTLWQRIVKILADPVTWKSLVYVLLEFPFGIFSFTLAVTLLSISVSLVLYPVVYIVLNSLYSQFPNELQGTMWPNVAINGHISSAVVINFLAGSAVGVVFTVGSVALVHGLG